MSNMFFILLTRHTQQLCTLALLGGITGITLLCQSLPAHARSIDEVMQRYAPEAEPTLKKQFSDAGVSYPPQKLALLAFKKERMLQIWAQGTTRQWQHITQYPILAASGGAGPKLRQGDYQVPEGLYRLQWLNPNSSFHLSMKVDYPNHYDREHARADGRGNPGGDIFIHGRAVSAGCLAMGDRVIETLFVLVQRTGVHNVQVIIAPHDFRTLPPPHRQNPDWKYKPAWVHDLYQRIHARLQDFSADGS